MRKLFKYTVYTLLFLVFIIATIGVLNSEKIVVGTLEHSKEWQGELLKINGETIRILQKGKGKNVLLVHGTPGSIEDWDAIIDSLSIHYKVTAFDRLGNGFSTVNTYEYTIDDNILLINSLIEKLKLDDIVLVGHSYGGSIAAKMAAQQHNKIKSVVVVASPLYSFEAGLQYKLLSNPFVGKGFATLISKTVASSMVEDGLKATFGTNTHLLTDDFVQIRAQIWSQSKVLFTTSKERSNYNEDLKESTKKYKKITKKISFLVGENDNSMIVNDFKTIKKALPNASFVYLNNVAHFIQFEATDELLIVIKSHLE